MSTRLRIRDATREDVPLIFNWIVELAEYGRSREMVRGTPELLGDALFAPRPTAEAVIAETREDDGASWRPAGFALFHLTFSTWECWPGIWLEDLYVPAAQRRAGVGRQAARSSPTWPGSPWPGATLAFSGPCSMGTRRRSTSTPSSARRDSTS